MIGGSYGIGACLLEQLEAQDDIQVTVISRNRPEVTGNYQYVEADVTEGLPDVDLPEIHGLVYLPGTINLKPFHRLKQEDFQADLQVNVLSAIEAVQHFLRPMKAAKGASVVLFSTVAVKLGMPFHSSVAVSKGALEALTRSLAAEYSQNQIRFNCIAPSVTDTPLAAKLLSDDKRKEASARRHPLGRYGAATDIASSARFLLSEDSDWMTGQVLNVDGGLSSLKLI